MCDAFFLWIHSYRYERYKVVGVSTCTRGACSVYLCGLWYVANSMHKPRCLGNGQQGLDGLLCTNKCIRAVLGPNKGLTWYFGKRLLSGAGTAVCVHTCPWVMHACQIPQAGIMQCKVHLFSIGETNFEEFKELQALGSTLILLRLNTKSQCLQPCWV
jgi:hypothetical protein